MKSKIILGIDPGLYGAIAGLDCKTQRIIFTYPMPIMDAVAGGEFTGRKYYDIESTHVLMERIAIAYDIDFAILEWMGAFLKNTLVALGLGKASMLMESALTVNSIKYEGIDSKVWKKYFGLIKKDKDASVAKVKERYPEFNFKRFRKQDTRHGVADAVLMAVWGLEVENG